MAIAVTISWDGKEPAWLAEAVRSVDAQLPAARERVLVVDSPEPEARLVELGQHGVDPGGRGWGLRTGSWLDPSVARNVGLAATTADWVIFWDADNVMRPGFLAAAEAATRSAGPEVGIVYTDIEYVDAHRQHPHRWGLPEYDYWRLRASNFIDTASVWRRGAVELAGGWPTGLASFEDWALALEVTRRGWTARKRPGPPVEIRRHPDSRSEARTRSGARRGDVWPVRTLAIASLLAGRDSTYERWERFLRTAELPRRTSLYVVDNSGDPAFGARVQRTCAELASARDLAQVTVLVRPEQHVPQPEQGYFDRARHLHVARLYSDLFPRISEDLTLTLEDDVEPPPDAIRRLVELLGVVEWGNVGAVAGAYDMADGYLCAGRPGWGWGDRIPWRDVGDGPLEAGCVGGGCTLWAGWALAAAPVSFRWAEGLGWDGSLCTDLRRRGHRIQVHGGVRCLHHIHGRIRSA